MNRKIFHWKLRNSELALGERTIIMGVLNITPDSFSDGGQFNDPDRAYARALELEEQGSDIIDIGAESTRPGSSRISADEEWQRLVPVLKRLRGKLRIPLSLDTYKSEIAERAMDYGIEVINDPSGLTFDANLARVAGAANAGLILNHMRGTPETWAKLPPLPDAAAAIARDLDATVNRARRAGVERNRIVIDPGLGFGKRGEQNAGVLAHLYELARLDLPILVGASRKAFLRQSQDDETVAATAAAVAAAILNGAHIVRVHDVRQIRAAALVADEIARAAAEVRVHIDRGAARVMVNGRDQERRDRGPMENRPRPPRPPITVERKPESDSAEARQTGERAHAAGAGRSPYVEVPPPGMRFEPRPERGRPPREAGPYREDRGGAGRNNREGMKRDDNRSGERPRRFESRPERGRSGPPRDRDMRGDRSAGDRPGGVRFGNERPRESGDDRPRDERRPSRFAGFSGRGSGKQGRTDQARTNGGRPPKRPFRKRP